jgi:hypothetical protein
MLLSSMERSYYNQGKLQKLGFVVQCRDENLGFVVQCRDELPYFAV